MSKSLPRGIRNHNPGNIEKGTKWQGLADTQPDSRFCTFTSPEYGIRALVRILHTYRNKYALHTIRGMISRWAPPSENNTEAYIRSVSKATDISATAHFPLSNIPETMLLVKAIIQHENGVQPYADDLIKRGVELTGLYK